MSSRQANEKQDIPTLAFTIAYDSMVNQLISDVHVMANGKECFTRALWDTGATGSCISSSIAADLNLTPTGRMMIRTPSGSDSVNTYLVDLGLPNQVKVEGVRVSETKIGEQGIGVLIGMDIIHFGDFAVSNHEGSTCFTFRMPSCSKIDFVKDINIQRAIGQKHGQGKRKRKKR